MAAITPFLEQQEDPAAADDLTHENLRVPAAVSESAGTLEDQVGAGAVEQLQQAGGVRESEVVFAVGELTAMALDKNHSELVTTAWIRASVEQALVGRSYRVQARDIKGGRPYDVFIVLDGPVAHPDGFPRDDLPSAPGIHSVRPPCSRSRC